MNFKAGLHKYARIRHQKKKKKEKKREKKKIVNLKVFTDYRGALVIEILVYNARNARRKREKKSLIPKCQSLAIEVPWLLKYRRKM